jgi:cysteine desulfurase
MILWYGWRTFAWQTEKLQLWRYRRRHWPTRCSGGDRVKPVAYLDYNATAPLRPEALKEMLPVLESVGNAASPHVPGRRAAASIAAARRQLADLLGCSAGEIFFTSGATEANNTALRACLTPASRLITSAVEHPAVLETARALAKERDIELLVLPVDSDGMLSGDSLECALRTDRPAVVSIMAANNETGVLSDLIMIADMTREAGAIFHTDATQLVGKLPIDLSGTRIDLLSLSAHKFGGPQGVGALFIRRGLGLPHRPLLHGGGQEGGWRAGTLNVAGIVGAGAAAAAAGANMAEETRRVRELRDLLEGSLLHTIPAVRVNGARDQRLPHVLSITFRGAPAEAVLAAMPGVAASDGSACSSGAPAPSHVLLAMGRSREDAESTVRFSLGYATSRNEIVYTTDVVKTAVARVRGMLSSADAVQAARRAEHEGGPISKDTTQSWLGGLDADV